MSIMVNAQQTNGYTDEGFITSTSTSNTLNNTFQPTNQPSNQPSTIFNQSFNVYTFSTSLNSNSIPLNTNYTLSITIRKKIKVKTFKVSIIQNVNPASNAYNAFAYTISHNGIDIIGSATNNAYVYTDKLISMPLTMNSSDVITAYGVGTNSEIDFTLPYSQILNINDVLQCNVVNPSPGTLLSIGYILFVIIGIGVD